MRKLLLVQPYIAQYQARMLELVRDRLAATGIAFEILVDSDHPQAGARSDSAELSFARELPAWRLRAGQRRVAVRRVWAAARGADLVILEQALGKPEIYRLLAPRRMRPRIALFGHGWIRSRPTNSLERRTLDLLTRRADWFFAYTQSGADHAARIGVPRSRITVINNSTDTRQLREWSDCVSDDEVEAERMRLGLRPGPTLLYIGALDPSKRPDLLIDACDVVARSQPDLNVLICGAGPLERETRAAAASRPFLHVVGPKFDRDKALMGRISDLLVIPAAVGLVAVDALAMRLPLVTTHGPFHGPEFDYLVDGENAAISDRTPEALASAINDSLLREARANLDGDLVGRPIPTVEDSAHAMATGIARALQA